MSLRKKKPASVTTAVRIEHLSAMSFATKYVAQPEILPLFCAYLEARIEKKAVEPRKLGEETRAAIGDSMKAAGEWADQKIRDHFRHAKN
jgi:hypothetical protein